MVKKYLWIFLLMILFISACSAQKEETRLARKEVLYTFQLDENECTDFIGRGMIKDVSPQKVFLALRDSISNLGYITILEKTVTVDLPWPYSDIEESISVTTEQKNMLLTFRGTEKMQNLTIQITPFQESSLVAITGNICIDMPTFLRENVLSSFIKKIIQNLRDALE